MHLMRYLAGGVVFAMVSVARAQTPASPAPVPETITAAGLARHAAVLAQDSMRQRGGLGLERTAQYVADQFRHLGLLSAAAKPSGDSKRAWLQRYPLPGQTRVNPAASRVTFSTFLYKDGREILSEAGRPITQTFVTSFAAQARFVGTTVSRLGGARFGDFGPFGIFRPTPLLVTGRHTAASLARAAVDGKTVLYVPPAGSNSAAQQQVIDQLFARTNGVVVINDEDSAAFAQRRDDVRRLPLVKEEYLGREPHWAIAVQQGFLAEFLTVAGIDLRRIRHDTVPMIRELMPLGVELDARRDTAGMVLVTAPNVVGILPGSDSVLKREYIVFMTPLGQASGSDTSRSPTVDDNMGLSGLIELAKAFRSARIRPKRSVIFLAVSGSSNGFLGSNYFISRPPRIAYGRNIITTSIMFDGSGRGATDTLAVAGIADLKLAKPLEWIAAEHPDLGLTVIDGGSAALWNADHLVFMRRVIPSLYFHHGSHDGARKSAEQPQAANEDGNARFLRLLYYVGQDIAAAPSAPVWTPEGRQARARLLGE